MVKDDSAGCNFYELQEFIGYNKCMVCQRDCSFCLSLSHGALLGPTHIARRMKCYRESNNRRDRPIIGER